MTGMAGKNPRRQIQGKQARASGKLFEDMIRASCKWHKAEKLAKIEKAQEPVRQLGPMSPHGQFTACYETQAEPDYQGTIRGGRSIVFEAKHTDGDRIQRVRVSEKQAEALELHHELGARAYVFVSFGFQLFFRIPWPVWRDMKQTYGRQYLKPEELGQYRITAPGGILMLLDGILIKTQEGAQKNDNL